MRAFVTRHTTTVGADLNRLRVSDKATADERDLRTFSLNSSLFGFPANPAAIGNFFYASWPGLFEEIIVGPSIRFFDDSWGRAFLRHCCRNLRPDGTLHVTLKHPAPRRDSGVWSEVALTEFLRPKAIRRDGLLAAVTAPNPVQSVRAALSGDQPITIRSPSPDQFAESTLDWFVQGAAAHTLYEILVRNSGVAAAVDQRDFFLAQMVYDGTHPKPRHGEKSPESGDHVGVAPARKTGSSICLDAELGKSLKAQSYYVGGIAYKGPVLKHILRQNGLSQRPLIWVDFGGGYGLLVAELLLDPTINVKRGIVRDMLPINRSLAGNMFRHLAPRMRNRFFFSLGFAEDFEFRERVDLVSFIGSLLYVPIEKRLSTLETCWEALSLGGLLVVHENIKAPSYGHECDIMFTVEELDAILRRFGKIQRYSSTELRSLSAVEAGEKSVFRVVHKTTKR